jgi:hypothetical protein
MSKMWNEMNINELAESAEMHIHLGLFRGGLRSAVRDVVVQAWQNGIDQERKNAAPKPRKRRSKGYGGQKPGSRK